jgi:outer membrane protein
MKVRVFAFFIMLCLCIVVPNVSGQTDLVSLINYSLEHSRDIRKSNLQVQEAGYIYKEARGHGLPQIEASASYSKMMIPDLGLSSSSESIGGMLDMIINESVSADAKQKIKDQLAGALNQIGSLDALYTASAGIQITQLIYSQSFWVGLKTAKKTQELYSILKTKSEEEVIADVATGYYQAGSLMLQLQSVDKSINNLKEIHRIAELSYKNDLIKESTVNRLKVTISNLQVTRQTIKNGVDIQINYLKALSGMPSDSALSIDTTIMVNNFIKNNQNIGFSAENVPSYQALLKQDEVYNQQIKLTKATYYPTLAAFGKLNYSSYSTSADISSLSNMNTIGLSFSMPIFTSGVNNARVKQAKIKQAELKEDIEKTKDLLAINYNNAYLEYQTAGEMLAAQKDNRDLALKVYNQTSLQYKEGLASMADLLNVNSDFLQADNSYNQQILKCKTSEIKMLKASGNLKSLVNNK